MLRKLTFKYREKVRCNACGKEDEGVELCIKILKIIPIKAYICESCISKIFRKFKPER